jgi:hypothetical protein
MELPLYRQSSVCSTSMCSTSRLGLKPSKPIIYTNIPPQTQGGDEEAILSLDTRSRKRPGGWDLVKTSAS